MAANKVNKVENLFALKIVNNVTPSYFFAYHKPSPHTQLTNVENVFIPFSLTHSFTLSLKITLTTFFALSPRHFKMVKKNETFAYLNSVVQARII
jgi:hypothetical protein